MATVLLDSSLLIYAVKADDEIARGFVSSNLIYASEISRFETLGYHAISTEEKSAL